MYPLDNRGELSGSTGKVFIFGRTSFNFLDIPEKLPPVPVPQKNISSL